MSEYKPSKQSLLRDENKTLRADNARLIALVERLKEAGNNLIQLANFGNKKAAEYTDAWDALMKELEAK